MSDFAAPWASASQAWCARELVAQQRPGLVRTQWWGRVSQAEEGGAAGLDLPPPGTGENHFSILNSYGFFSF